MSCIKGSNHHAPLKLCRSSQKDTSKPLNARKIAKNPGGPGEMRVRRRAFWQAEG
jgi:hypothetical protein